MKSITVDYQKRLAEEPGKGHNRWHEAVAPVIGAALGEEVEIETRDDDGRPRPAGEPGELYVRGPNTCVGFFDDATRTAATFVGAGWVRSGDLVTIDEQNGQKFNIGTNFLGA